MPKFTTVSPTHVPGKKDYAWQRVLEGKYVAIGWLHEVDLSGKTLDEIESLIRQRDYNHENAIQSFKRFLSLDIGDYVGVNNTGDGLFGVGIVRSGYKFQQNKHDIGSGDPEDFYSHYLDVEWVHTSYAKRRGLVFEGETAWQPYGTVGKPSQELPPYILRLLGKCTEPSPEPAATIRPSFLEPAILSIEALRQDSGHLERAHESLVEEFLSALGYEKHKDIVYRKGQVDITVTAGGLPLAVVEVKRNWSLSRYDGVGAIRQAYNYAHEKGIRYVLVTNGDTYLVFDRLKGLSWDTNVVGEFQLTSLVQDDLALIDRLRPERLRNPDFAETLRYLSECFAPE